MNFTSRWLFFRGISTKACIFNFIRSWSLTTTMCRKQQSWIEIPGFHLYSFTCIISSYVMFDLLLHAIHIGTVFIWNRESKCWVLRIFFTVFDLNYSKSNMLKNENFKYSGLNKRLFCDDWPEWFGLFYLKKLSKVWLKIESCNRYDFMKQVSQY